MYVGTGPLDDGLLHSIPRHIRGAKEAKRALEPLLKDREYECFIVVHLSHEMETLQFACHRGSPTEVLAPTKKIINDAAELGTRALILAHNHPSGSLTASDSDYRTTRRLVSACEALDVAVIDHLIYGAGDWLSFRESGYL